MGVYTIQNTILFFEKKSYILFYIFSNASNIQVYELTSYQCSHFYQNFPVFRSSSPEVFLGKSILKLCCKFTREHPCLTVISRKLQSNVIEIGLRYGCSPVNLLHIFRTPFPKNTSGWLLLWINPFCAIF